MIIAILCYVVFNQYIEKVIFNQFLRRHCENQSEIKILVTRNRQLEIQWDQDPGENILNFKKIVETMLGGELSGIMSEKFGRVLTVGEYSLGKDEEFIAFFIKRLEEVKNKMDQSVSFIEKNISWIKLMETEEEEEIELLMIELMKTCTEEEIEKLVIKYIETGMEQFERRIPQALPRFEPNSSGSSGKVCLKGSESGQIDKSKSQGPVIEDRPNNKPTPNVKPSLKNTDSKTTLLVQFLLKVLLKILEEIRSNPEPITEELFLKESDDSN
jgi:hypothetical protein